MTNNKNLENMNAEVQTAEEQEHATVVATIPEGNEDVKPNDEHPQPNNENSGNDAQDNPGEETPDDETAENEEEAPKDKISNREKIILIVIALLLFALLAWGAATIINGWQRDAIDNNSGSGLIITETTGDIDSSTSTGDNYNKNDGDASNAGDDNGNRYPGMTQQIQGNTSHNDDTEPTDKNQSDDTDNTTNKTDDTSKPDGGESTTSKPDNTDKDDDQSKPTTDTVKDYIGDTTIRIANVNDDTAIINLTVDGKIISVPVQTTYFNGRITKTGVSQVKLFGYNSGVTVLLYYPKTDGFAYNEVNGYMSRTADGLTVLVDINGEGTKLLVKINGMKSLF